MAPQHWDDEPFDLIVCNPPFSRPWKASSNPVLINDPRFAPAGVLAPDSKGDLAFVMHCLSWLSADGAAAIVCFPGIMYRGGAEQKIRKYLIDNNFVDAVIQLPSNLFLNVTISVDIMVLRKNKKDNRVLFVDASGEFVKVTKNNRLSEENISRIVKVVSERSEIAHFSHLSTYDEVVENGYNLSISSYVEAEDTREKVDIIKLNAEIESMSSVLTQRTDEKLYLNSFCMGYRLNNPNLFEPDFLKHLFRSTELRRQISRTANGVTRFNVSKEKMRKVKIPVPPLEVQREIVRILDNFTELTARKKQYEYYRDHLLSFGTLGGSAKG